MASYSRVFSRFGKLHAHDWRALHRLVLYLCHRGRSGAQRPSSDPPIPARAAARYAHHYLDMPLDRALANAGWEWALEQALRVAGYVSPDGAVATVPLPRMTG